MAKEEEKKEEGAPAEKKGGAMKLIIIINAVVVLLLVVVVVVMFMLKGGDEKKDTEVLADEGQAAAEGDHGASTTGKTPIYIPMNPPFVVNLENQEQISFLQVEMEAMTYDAKVEEAMKVHSSRIRSELLMLLGSKQYHEISNIEGKRKLSQDAITIIQNILSETGTKGTVEALYFTSFVMQ